MFDMGRRAHARLELTVMKVCNRQNYAPPAVDVSTPATVGMTTSGQSAGNAGSRSGQLAFRSSFRHEGKVR